MAVARELLLMRPAQRQIVRAVTLRCVGRPQPAAQEPVEPPVLPLAVQAQPAGVERVVVAARRAAPIEPRRGVHVVAQHPVISHILDVATIAGAVPYDVTNAEARRENATMSADARVREHE